MQRVTSRDVDRQTAFTSEGDLCLLKSLQQDAKLYPQRLVDGGREVSVECGIQEGDRGGANGGTMGDPAGSVRFRFWFH